MKILQICSARTIGGGEKHLVDLVNGLHGRGHEVYAAIRPDSGLRAELQALPEQNILTLQTHGPLNILNAVNLARFIRDRKIDVIHGHIAPDYLLAAFAAKRAGRGKLVITRHVLFQLNKLHSQMLKRVDGVIAVSRAVADSLHAFDPARITVIHNGIDLSRFTRDGDASDWLQSSIKSDIRNSFIVGMVGHLAPIKGQEEFVKAAAIVSSRRNDVAFVIAGEDKSRTGENRRQLEQLINNLGLEGRVHLLGWVDNVPRLLPALDLLISPSRSEPFGLSIVEAMACEVPIIATRSEGALEILEDGVTGKLLKSGNPEELADAIVSLLDDEEKRRRLVAQALEVVRGRFALESMVSATEQVYENLLARHGAR
ncbi:MAG TPA: glycosyltransferase [Pyrinomonadaceae bacterium]|nr:glycosyltransferase [Pyrinomonadaceae bacterium]